MSLHPLAHLEGAICDLDDMADLAASYIGDVVSTIEGLPRGSRILGPAEARLIQFCVYHFSTMASELKNDFYKKLGEGRPSFD